MVASAPFPTDVQFALHEIGGKGEFSDAGAKQAAADFVGARKTLPNAEHMIVVGGYDDDPRSLWDIPEARDYVRRFVLYVQLADIRPLADWKLNQPSIALVAMCTGVGRITATDPVTGVHTIEVDTKP